MSILIFIQYIQILPRKKHPVNTQIMCKKRGVNGEFFTVLCACEKTKARNARPYEMSSLLVKI